MKWKDEFTVGGKNGSRERYEVPSFLTRRQREVLQLLAEGHSVKEVFLSQDTNRSRLDLGSWAGMAFADRHG
jgi:hypothetical protein